MMHIDQLVAMTAAAVPLEDGLLGFTFRLTHEWEYDLSAADYEVMLEVLGPIRACYVASDHDIGAVVKDEGRTVGESTFHLAFEMYLLVTRKRFIRNTEQRWQYCLAPLDQGYKDLGPEPWVPSAYRLSRLTEGRH